MFEIFPFLYLKSVGVLYLGSRQQVEQISKNDLSLRIHRIYFHVDKTVLNLKLDVLNLNRKIIFF